MSPSVGSPFLWTVFSALIVLMLAIDLGLFHRKPREVSIRESLSWVAVWITLALLFNLWILRSIGGRPALEFFTGYVIEYALSVDNLFVFLILLLHFQVPSRDQHRVIFWGILGAVVLRGVFIFTGTALLRSFEWLIYPMGAFLVLTGAKTMRQGEGVHDPTESVAFRLGRKYLRLTPGFHGSKFFVRQEGKLYATPLFLVLLLIDVADVVFAVDSVPAVLSITRDPFIVFTSNMFAILGLRALYFVLARAMGKIHYLKFGLGLVLIFVGGKMLVVNFVDVSVTTSLAVVGAILGSAVIASIVREKRKS
jgi:tellurite resistance protein TerC